MPFAPLARPQSPLRDAITAAWREDEQACVLRLIDQARMPPEQVAAVQSLARKLVEEVRGKRTGASGVDALMQEFSLSSQEGIALMCLAEALLRIPDPATADRLIRDKLARGDWRAHLGHSPSIFVNAATWGLLITGKLVATTSEKSLGTALTRLIAKSGEPVIRTAVDLAMRLLGKQFVTGETIEEALKSATAREARGYRFSYDMLGEAAMTAADAARYLASYEHAIHAIGKASRGRGIYAGPGISVKLSALHPRYARAQHARVMAELLPRLKSLLLLARRYDIGLNIDAEEADRLELSLDLIEAVATDPELAGWDGIGIVVQAYQKRCPFVLDWLIDLARRTGHRFMVRLVKGAYWDSEIKRAQVDGQLGYPVYTRKVHTDVAYLACAKKLLAATDAVYPQFATHNAYTPRRRPRARPRPGLGVPVPARHGRDPLRRGRPRGHAEPPLPRLRPGRHPRDPARLSRPPPARERRQLLLRQPPGRPRRLGRRAGGRPGRHGRAHTAARPTAASRCRATSTPPSAPTRKASTSPASTTCAGSTRACRPAPGPPPPSSPAAPTIPATAPPSATPPTTPTSSAPSARPPPTRSRTPWPPPMPPPRAGPPPRSPNAPSASSAPPTSWKPRCAS